ncbi:hypothetical protein KR49_00765 [Synechococcus sp. KORDI-49]|jgi:hypothetical protein|nr:hypothetical protein KR49_00765 [Synechococcus sp. KORDI-49]
MNSNAERIIFRRRKAGLHRFLASMRQLIFG